MEVIPIIKARQLTDKYLTAREEVICSGYGHEIDWQETRCLSLLSESDFLQESAWVILSAGMKEKIIRSMFHRISTSFLNWKDAASIVERAEYCTESAIALFNNPRKINSILSLCRTVKGLSFENVRESIYNKGIDFLKTFDFIGPVTCYHLAKNIGLDVVKPDRHLVRMAKAAKLSNPYTLCYAISELTGDKISVVDLVLWRYATIRSDYIAFFNV